jgi:hypothetical protein
MFGRGDLQFNVVSVPWEEAGSNILHIPRLLSLVEINISACEQKTLHTDPSMEQSQNPLTESPISYPETARLPLFVDIILDHLWSNPV